jgi:hypothetical protein
MKGQAGVLDDVRIDVAVHQTAGPRREHAEAAPLENAPAVLRDQCLAVRPQCGLFGPRHHVVLPRANMRPQTLMASTS